MKLRLYIYMWLSFFAFLIFGIWEFAQTPFFIDYTDSFNEIVYNRFHCTVGDILILLGSVLVSSLIFKNTSWLKSPEFKHYFTVSAAGVSYTVFSEINNVYHLKSWGYSDVMPTVFGIGLLPVIQWMVLPAIIIFITKNYVKGHYNHKKRKYSE